MNFAKLSFIIGIFLKLLFVTDVILLSSSITFYFAADLPENLLQ